MNKETPKAKKVPAYRAHLNTEHANELYIRILKKLTTDKLYRDPDYTSARLAQDLQTHTRHISAAVAVCSGGNYCALVNSLRLRDACRMMRSPVYKKLTVEEIGLLAGFASRQAFYLAFSRVYDCTPRTYRYQTDEE